jgi:DNA-binding PadR family transcriptional regulator
MIGFSTSPQIVVVAPGGDDVKSMERLEAAGLVRRGRPYHETHYYHATEKGCEVAGLNKTQTKNALES